MDFLRIRNWERWQSYRSDRTPPWIKLHRGLLLNPDWQQLSDAEKGALVSIWMLAAERNGRVPNDAELIRKLCNLGIRPPLERFLSLQFLEKIKNRRRRVSRAHVVLEESREEESREEEIPPYTPPVDSGRGTRFARNGSIPAEWRSWAVEAGHKKPDEEFDRFSDYWIAQPGAKGRKTDWLATWRNWIRRSMENGPTAPRTAGRYETAHERIHRVNADPPTQRGATLEGHATAVDEDG